MSSYSKQFRQAVRAEVKAARGIGFTLQNLQRRAKATNPHLAPTTQELRRMQSEVEREITHKVVSRLVDRNGNRTHLWVPTSGVTGYWKEAVLMNADELELSESYYEKMVVSLGDTQDTIHEWRLRLTTEIGLGKLPENATLSDLAKLA